MPATLPTSAPASTPPDAPPGARLRLHPADAATLAILAVVTATLAAAVLRGVPLGGWLALHAALLAGYGALAAWRRRGSTALRAAGVIGVMFTLYATLGQVAFDAIPWNADRALALADRALLLGRAPVLEVAAAVRGAAQVEFFAVFYAAFIPYLYMSIFLGLVGRPAAEREEFVTGFAFLYALSFLGYLFLPARGPIVELAAEFGGALRGGAFHRLVVDSVATTGGPHGAFPSLHVGATSFALLFDLRHRTPLRGLIYLPLLLGIAAATLVLRYHYAIDLLAGAALALLANLAAARVLRRAAP